jgi:hypothetical protein
MRMRLALWVLLPCCIGITAYLARSGRLGITSLARVTPPMLECPATLDFGHRELGEHAVVHFCLGNSGGSDLLVNHVVTSCSCAGLEREVDGRFLRVDSLRLGAHETTDLVLRVAVGGAVGAEFRNTVRFHTNDPAHSEAQIEAVVPKITGGVFTRPANIVFGEVPVGGDSRQVLEVFDDAITPRRIRQASSSDPERLTVRVLPPPEDAFGPRTDKGDVLIGRLETVLSRRDPASINARIEIHLDDGSQSLTSVPVTARVRGLVEAMPKQLVLPRSSGSGPVYYGDCFIRGTDTKQLNLLADSVPKGLRAEVLSRNHGPNMRVVRIHWDKDIAADLDRASAQVVPATRSN